MKVKIRVLKGGVKPIKAEGGDWYDLYTRKMMALIKGEYWAIPLGVAMELPKGYEAIVVPRSSTFKKYGILQCNSVGIIDEAYKGDNDEWHMLVYATRNIIIPERIRICQFRIIKHQPSFSFEVVDALDNPDRGGIGSTDAIEINHL